MNKEDKHKLDKLQYPKWFNVLFTTLTVIVPIVFFVYQCFIDGKKDSDGIKFKVSFLSIVILLLSWLLINHFIIKKFTDKLAQEQVMLKHDYDAEIGNKEKIRLLWYKNEKWLSFINAITVLLIVAAVGILFWGIQNEMVDTRGAMLLILASYAMAYTSKFLLLISKKEADDETDDRRQNEESSKNDNSKIN